MEPLWLRTAYEEMRRGVKEIPGDLANPQIIQWFEALGQGWVRSDETPNCAAFVGFHLLQAGIPMEKLPSNPLGARQYLRFGTGVSMIHPPLGAVLVFKRGGESQPGPEVLDALGHTGFFFGHGFPGQVLCLGANQGDRVCIEAYPMNRLLGVRYPAAEG